TGVGIVVSKNLEHIGPLAIAAVIALAAAACYVWAVWKRTRTASLADDYVLLLGSLLLSADIGYIEHQWHLLGPVWPRHFLLLAVIHAAVAYWFGSRVVLSLSISALAAWFGIERQSPLSALDRSSVFAVRAFLCAGTLVIWRWVDRLRRGPIRDAEPSVSFSPVFDHAALNLAFWGSLVLMVRTETRLLGCVIAVLLAVLAAWHGVRRGEERFVIYAWIYGTIAIDVQICWWLNEEVLILFFLLVSTAVAIAGLITAHQKMRRRTA
ncbi:MAG: hypothetical protein ABIP63_10065, partial [Thermoanaerobaculia bacterium]